MELKKLPFKFNLKIIQLKTNSKNRLPVQLDHHFYSDYSWCLCIYLTTQTLTFGKRKLKVYYKQLLNLVHDIQ